MIIKSLTLKNFRNHKNLTLQFKKNLNIFTGPNAAGKTNIVEAIHYLSLARSFRTSEDEELISKGSQQAEIQAVCAEGELNRKIQIIISKNGKSAFINGKPISRIIDLFNTTNVLLFEPDDVKMFRDTPSKRREFLDVNLCKKSKPYLDYSSKYKKVLRERNEILKSENVDKDLLDSTTELLVKLSGPIVSYRQMYVKDINDILNKITRALTGEKGKLEIIYKPFVEYGRDFTKQATEAFKRAEERDLHQKATSIGVHREDFSIALNGRDIGQFGSQGENRIVAIALKLSPYFLIDDKDKRPIVVLDDVMSELDKAHGVRLIKFLQKLEQVFITATNLKVEGAAQYQIKTKE